MPFKISASYGALVVLLASVQAAPVSPTGTGPGVSTLSSRGTDDWVGSLSNDTRYRLELARKYVSDGSAQGQAYRNDTIMRVNIEREALDESLIDLLQAFNFTLPVPRSEVTVVDVHKRTDAEDFREDAYLRSGTMTSNKRDDAEDFREDAYLRSGTMTSNKRSDAEDFREEAYLRSGTMTSANKRDDAEDSREEAYLRSGTMTSNKRDDAEDSREEAYLRSGTMTSNKRSDAEDFHEDAYLRSGSMTSANKRDDAEDFREDAYLRSGTMTSANKRSDAEDFREDAYLRSGTMTSNKRDDAEDFREDAYLRSGTMTSANKRNDAEDFREDAYLRSGSMTSANKRSDAEDFREEAYLRSGTMTSANKRSDDTDTTAYHTLLNQDSLALGAIERVNVAHRVLGQPELTVAQANATASHGDDFINDYWNASMHHGGFWTTDQPSAKPNFIEGGQDNGFGFTQSTYHRLHCLANLRTMLAWHITGNGDKMTRDMNVHTIHCLDYIHARELAYPDLNEEPIDTINYKGMGIH